MSDRVGNPDLFIMGADGANPVNLTVRPGIDVSPTWRPRPLTTLVRARSWGQIKAQRGYPGPFSTGAK